MVRLAVPVVLGELGWMGMGVVDTIMVGALGPAAIGAIGVGSSVYYSAAIFGVGLLLGMDTLVSQAHGAGNRADTYHSLMQAVYGALAIGSVLTVAFTFVSPVFGLLGINKEVAAYGIPFVRTLALGTLPLLFYAAFRRYLQGVGKVKPVMFALISANLVNWLFNWLLIYGHWGLPKLGVAGSALSTCLARLYMAVVLLGCICWLERKHLREIPRPPDAERLLHLLRLGLPAATQILLEIGAFGAAAVLAARLTPQALAAHQIALTCASVSFMVPLGISSASAIAVGQDVGRGDRAAAKRSGYIGISLGCAFMACAALVFLVFPRQILGIYTTDTVVLALGVRLLAIAAAFQLFDGVQTVTTGALRGLGNTRTPMFVNFVGYWLFGLPIGYALCFMYGFGVAGLWMGLTAALVAISLILLATWRRSWLTV